MALNADEICIKGSKYRIVDTETVVAGGAADAGMYLSTDQQAMTENLQTLEDKVDKIIDIMGYGSSGGGYRSINLTLNPREQKYQVMLGIYANQINIRADQALLLNMNSKSNEDIFIEVAEFPFALSDLRRNEAVHTLYFTTGANTTVIKIFAIGTVQ